MSRTFKPGDTVKFRVSPGNAFFTVVACDGVLVTFNDGAEVVHVPIGDICRT